MEKKGYVSLWIGNIKNEELLSNYVELVYTDDGDFLPSPFLTDFNIDIDDFDEDFLERVVHDRSNENVRDLIAGCSYDEVVIPRFEAMNITGICKDTNSAILLYNFKYNARKKEVIKNGYEFRFVGSVSYI
ncbi:immunity 22 family protein [Fictibacillus sp. Mic-4]|uniref:immunity 22 family protein n=1 Tax=Fictibacillus TaxID=1329200 RepID=UPI00040A9890|nr:immunity 22 family protein [Fictibacillus gelatini]